MEIENDERETSLEPEYEEIEIQMQNEPYIGGGGPTYTEGFGIDISDENEISVDTDEIQEKLIAGKNITIDENNKIDSKPFTTLTEDDYNWPVDNPDGIALWSLPTAMYHNPGGIKVYITAYYNDNSYGITTISRIASEYGDDEPDVGAYASIEFLESNGALHVVQVSAGVGIGRERSMVLRINDIVDNLTTHNSLQTLSAEQGTVLKGLIDDLVIPSVVQTTGQSETDVMSQKAITDILGNIESALNIINNGTES